MNVMRWTIGPVMIALAGCAMTPAEVMERGTRFDTTHATTPQTVAECIERHVENTYPSMLVRDRPLETNTPGARELIVRILGEAPDTGAVVHLLPAATGTKALWFVSPNLIHPGPEQFRDRVRGSC